MSPTLHVDFEHLLPGGPAIVASLDLDFGAGLVAVLFGPSGAGKTTLLRCLAGLESPSRGLIRLDGERWHDAGSGVRVRPQRRGIGYVSQELSLFPHLSARRNIEYALGTQGAGRRAGEMLGFVGLDGLEDRLPSALSGGQKQRLAIARALARRPRLVLLDEPLSSLDAASRERFRDDLRALLVRCKTPTIVVTHDRDEALVLGDQVAVMLDGRIAQTGPVLDVFARPSGAAVAAAVGVDTIAEGRVISTSEMVSRVAVAGAGAELVAVNEQGIGGDVYVCIRAQDVTLAPDLPDAPAGRASGAGTSARTRLRGRIISVVRGIPLIRVSIDCGFMLKASLTRESVEELGITEGRAVVAMVKAPNVHLVPRLPR